MNNALPNSMPRFRFSHADAENAYLVDKSTLLLIAIIQELNQRRAPCVLESINIELSARI